MEKVKATAKVEEQSRTGEKYSPIITYSFNRI